jgi:hypothetical protein
MNIIKEYKYPNNMEEVVRFIKERDLDLFEKIV